MKLRTSIAVMALGMLMGTTPTFAHHSTAMYNMATPTTVTGTVKRFEWTNPHAFIYLEVTDESGKKAEWAIEMMSLNHLKSYRLAPRYGEAWRETITCTGGACKKRRSRHAGIPDQSWPTGE